MSVRRPRASARLVVVAVVALAAVLGALPARATAPAPDAPAAGSEAAPPQAPADELRWSVGPADADGRDERTSVELTLDPGERAEDRFEVENLSDREITFRLAAADGFYTRNGRFDVLASGQESVAAGTWVDLPGEVTVEAGGTEVVPFTVTVPERAEPGDHAAGITASVLSTQTADDGASVGVESRVGFRVLTRVTGEIAPAASVDVVAAAYDTSWNPFRPGAAVVAFDVVNDGNTRLLVQGAASGAGGRGAFPPAGETRQELLPGDERRLQVEVRGVWPLLYVPLEVVVDPEAATMDGASPPVGTVAASTVLWAVPWPQLLLLAGVVLVLVSLLAGRRRSRRRLDSMLEAAREQGRRDAAPDAS
ncbi:WxL protein peptidoglycan domain-containing protein [Aquipuribacter sp. SD81]|uniref:WxL protein peptidoglycan domain-containing protein n=1 Tax=Aquipuribacter sp. SD81 TaxID=3127703 RepID=UPI00301AB6D2